MSNQPLLILRAAGDCIAFVSWRLHCTMRMTTHLQWLDWIPPMVITQSWPLAKTSAIRNSSFRTLLPDSCMPAAEHQSVCMAMQRTADALDMHTKIAAMAAEMKRPC